MTLTNVLRRALLAGVAVVGLVACSDDGDTADTSVPSTPDTTEAASTTTTEPSTPTTDAPPTSDSVPPTSEPTPTLAQEIPDEELPDRLLEVFTENFGDANFAFCVQQNVLQGLEDGTIAPVDIDNYVRNNITDPMRSLLIQIQNDGVCSG
ncbi:MAG TPA: hypothetical protein DCR14_15900 [Acidimicrobiaceae bacterium]|nr:hypothetical protein [Acidimicrobiaceae bacterium]